MHHDHWPCRQLYTSLLGTQSSTLWASVLEPWLREFPGEARWLSSFAASSGIERRPVEESWRLYGMSRVVDQLLAWAQVQADQVDQGRWAETERFIEAVGMRIEVCQPFAPAWHEVVVAEPGEGPIRVVRSVWPTVWLGTTVFLRGGVVVQAPRDRIDPNVLAASVLGWTHHRRFRTTYDASRGWGSNSQWRTAFMRNVVVSGRVHYNVDTSEWPLAAGPARGGPDGLTPEQRLELLRYRCWVTAMGGEDPCWPNGAAHSEPVPAREEPP